MRRHKMLTQVALSLGMLIISVCAEASDFTQEVLLLDKAGNAIKIGTISFSPKGASDSYQLEMLRDPFQDYFLSMKEMKCLPGDELWCHIPYPYESPRVVTDQDGRWLSHDLLFMYKRKGEYGANLWNGIYYKLEKTTSGWQGVAQAVDLNKLAAPPDDLTVPPLTQEDLDDIDRASRRLPDLVIR